MCQRMIILHIDASEKNTKHPQPLTNTTTEGRRAVGDGRRGSLFSMPSTYELFQTYCSNSWWANPLPSVPCALELGTKCYNIVHRNLVFSLWRTKNLLQTSPNILTAGAARGETYPPEPSRTVKVLRSLLAPLGPLLPSGRDLPIDGAVVATHHGVHRFGRWSGHLNGVNRVHRADRGGDRRDRRSDVVVHVVHLKS